MYDDRTNLAYDLELFEVDEEEQRRKAQKRAEKNKIKMTKKKAVARNGSVFMAVASIALVVVVAFAILYSKVQLSEYTVLISEAKTELQLAERENRRLNAELDSMVTLENVEKIASEELGLQKTEGSQIIFVTKNIEEMAQVAEGTSNIFLSIRDWFYNVLEYLGF
ncbi:MAG: hypothetical protein NC084_11895 [Bacteroides sp.]|nr:hypothetical protein [Eubacterium sp.]MCM1418329.1 hypothetical protein [Roseburia sp.]MCM1463394.1 hypothetical protein [Bacteroides sp.]